MSKIVVNGNEIIIIGQNITSVYCNGVEVFLYRKGFLNRILFFIRCVVSEFKRRKYLTGSLSMDIKDFKTWDVVKSPEKIKSFYKLK